MTLLRLLTLVILLMLLGRGSTVSAQSSSPELPQSTWVHLGLSDVDKVREIAVAPEWPTVPMLLAVRSDDSVVVTPDGGRSWDELGSSPVALIDLAIAPGVGSRRIIFARESQSASTSATMLYRSPDSGASWAAVMSLPSQAAIDGDRHLTFSPTFAYDGFAFLIAKDRLHRSQDGGRTWETLDLADGQRIRTIQFSPSFAADRTIFAVATTNGFPVWGRPIPDEESPDDHLHSLGVLISTDAGETWRASGPELNGMPYRHVQSLAVSPMYAQDGTLFAFAWGPREVDGERGSRRRVVRAALFRSTDRGASWQAVWEPIWNPQPPGTSVTPRFFVDMALSPSFASDGIALFAVHPSAGIPSSIGCTVFHTSDRGNTLTSVLGHEPRQTCQKPQLFPGVNAPVGFINRNPWLHSLDGGMTWQRIQSPAGLAWSGYAFAGDGTMFVGGRGGIWALGPSARPMSTANPIPAPAQIP